MGLAAIIGIAVGIAVLLGVLGIVLAARRTRIIKHVAGGAENRNSPYDLTDRIIISTVLARLSVQQSLTLIPDLPFDITDAPVRIGSGAHNDLVIPEEGVSYEHAEIRLGEDFELHVFPLQDEHPTTVNGREIGADGVLLHDSDELSLSPDTKIVIYMVNQTEPMPGRAGEQVEKEEESGAEVEQTRGIDLDKLQKPRQQPQQPKEESPPPDTAPLAPPAPTPRAKAKPAAESGAKSDSAKKPDAEAGNEKPNKGGISLSIGGDVGGDIKAAEGDIVGGDKITVGDITGSEGVAIGSNAKASVNKSDVGGDVHGDVMLAGGDITIINKEEALKYETQARRFDAAFPEKVQVKEPVSLWVAVARPSEPPPFEDITSVKLEDVTKGPIADIDLPIDPKTGKAKEVYIDVQVRAPRFEPARDSATLTVYPDGKSDKVRFLLEPQQDGKGEIIVQFYHDKKRLGEIELTSAIQKARAGKKLALTFQIASLYLAFGVG